MMILSFVLALIRGYQSVSRLFPPRCRFVPTCSQYAAQALTHYGLARGTQLTVVRLCKCHPFHPGGFDPVPVSNQCSELLFPHHDCA